MEMLKVAHASDEALFSIMGLTFISYMFIR